MLTITPRFGAGTSQQFYTSIDPLVYGIKNGSAAAPTTTPAPTFKVSRLQRITKAALEAVGGVGTDGGELSSAILGVAVGDASDEAMPVGVYGAAKQNGTGGGTLNDAVGVYGAGRIVGATAQGNAFGGYFHAWRENTTAKATGVEINVRNDASADASYTPTAANPVAGLWIYATGNKDPAVGVAVGNPSGQQFDVGFAVLGQVGGGDTGAAKTAAFRDDSNAAISLEQRGTHTTGIDQTNATLTNGALFKGHVLFPSDNTHDIGANGATRPRDIWAGGSIRANVLLQSVQGLRATGDLGSNAANTTMIVHQAIAARSSGVGTVLFADATSRNSVGMLKVWVGATAYYAPLFAAT